MPGLIASLIVPCRNQPGADRRGMIDALLAGLPDRPDLEVLLVDDGSSLPYDPPVFAALRLRRAHLGPGQSGAGAARNLGMAEAAGDWLIFADSDDLLDRAGLGRLLDGLAAGRWQGCDLIVPQAASFRDGDPARRGQRHLFANRRVARARALGDTGILVRVPACWMRVVRRDFVQAHGLRFGPAAIGEDVDFAVDLGLARPRTDLVDLVLPHIRDGHSSLTSDMGAAAREQVLAVKMAANARLRAGGLGRWDYPLLLDLIGLMRHDLRAGLRWWGRALAARSRLVPPLGDLADALRARLRTPSAGDGGS